MSNYSSEYGNNIKEYTFVPLNLNSVPGAEGVINFQTPSGSIRTHIQTLSNNFLECAYSGFYYPGEYDKNTKFQRIQNSLKKNGIGGLYENEGDTSTGRYHEENTFTEPDYNNIISSKQFKKFKNNTDFFKHE